MVNLRIVTAAVAVSLVPTGVASAAPTGSTLLLSGPAGPLAPLAGLVNDSGFGSALIPGETRVISSDGTKVVFQSTADAMDPSADDDVPGGIYVRDIPSNTTTLVSRATGAAGAVANGGLGSPTISLDGNRVAFISSATNLDPADTNPKLSVYVRDLTTNTTYLASRADGGAGESANDDSWQPALSSSGRFVAFTSGATNLSGPSAQYSVYRRDLLTDATAVVSTLTDGTTRVDGQAPSISPTGALVAFTSFTAIDAVNDTNGSTDVYIGTVGTTTVDLVSRANGVAGAVGDGPSYAPSLSTSGNDKVAFTSSAANLIGAADTNGVQDAFVRDLVTGATTLVSRATGGAGAISNQGANEVSITRDGLGVVFTSFGTNLGGPTDGTSTAAYLRSGTTTSLVSRATGATGDAANGFVTRPSADTTGAAISFIANATNLSTASDDDFSAVYVRRPADFTTTFVSRPTGTADFIGGLSQSFAGGNDMVSADGRYVIFGSSSDTLSGEDDNDVQNVFRFDVKTGTLTLVSRATGATGAPANGQASSLAISADGNRVLFSANAATSLDPDTPPTGNSLYLRDIAAGTTVIASRGPGILGSALSDVGSGVLSSDGHHVAYVVGAAIDGADTNGKSDVYVRDLDTGAVTLASRDNGAAGAVGNAGAQAPSLDADGSRVAWSTTATNLPGYDAGDVFFSYVRDLAAGTTTLAGRADTADGATVDAQDPSISDDGNRVAFGSHDLDVTADGADARQHIYVRDLAAGTTTLASRGDGAAGAPDNPPAGATTFGGQHSISADGNRVMFMSNDSTLVADDANASADAFVRDLAAGRTFAVGRVDGVDGALGSSGSGAGGLSANGQCAAFTARGTGLVAASVPGVDFAHIYLRAIDGPCPPDEPAAPLPIPAVPTTDAAPVLSAFSMSPKTFRVGPKRTAISAARRKKLPVGTTMRYRANESVTMTFTFSRRLPGRVKGKKCVKPTRKLRKRRACTRLVTAGKLTRKSATGRGSVKFSGRIGRKALRRGRYQVTAQATDSARQKSKKRTLRFTVKR